MTSPHIHKRQNGPVPETGKALRRRVGPILAALVLLAVTAWSYGPVLVSLYEAWRSSDDYSAGQLVPLVAILFVWRDRKALAQCPLVPCWWGGIALLLSAEVSSIYLFLAGGHPALEKYLIVFALAGLILLVAGARVFRRALWILLFLFLMFPLPGRVHSLIGGPLQSVATTGSVFFLEAFGVAVSQQGNVVVLNGNTPLAVAEVCSGLRMLTAFIVVAAFVAYMVRRPRWQKGALLLSSIPVGVICNMVRIVATALLMLYTSTEFAQKFFHDFAGYVMMPVAVLLLFGEIWLMDRLIVPQSPSQARRVVVRAKSAQRIRKTPTQRVPDCT